MLDNSGRKVDEQGQELAANASADETRVAVRGIVRVRDSMASNVGQDVVSLRANERADQMRRSRRQHSEPDRARATKQTDEHRLGAIVCVVARRNVASFFRSDSGLEREVAGFAGAGHQVRTRSHLDLGRRKRHAELGSETPNESKLLGRFRAQTMIDAVRRETRAHARCELREHVKKRHRIGAARNGDENEVSLPKKMLVDDGALGDLEKGRRMRALHVSSNALQKVNGSSGAVGRLRCGSVGNP